MFDKKVHEILGKKLRGSGPMTACLGNGFTTLQKNSKESNVAS